MKRRPAVTEPAPGAPPPRTHSTLNWLLLAAAWFAAWIVYSPVLQAHWFYDDSDYVLQDPRLDHLELFWPSHWHDAPPPLEESRDGPLVLPGYGQPLIKDRYLWRLSFALEKWRLGPAFSEIAESAHDSQAEAPANAPMLTWGETAAHADNLLIHLACIGALFFALTRLLALYLPVGRDAISSCDSKNKDGRRTSPLAWLPGAAALIFAVHPWAAEPVCYVSARDGSMGAFFVLLGLGLWAAGLQARRSWLIRASLIAGALLCALAAFGCKENFITAVAGYVLATWPVLWKSLARWGGASRVKFLAIAGGASLLALALAGTLAWVGISLSGRASGLWGQVAERGWRYFFEIQNPVLLTTLADQVLSLRLSLEANFPGWPDWACAVALVANAALFLLGALGGKRWPLLLGLSWFYLHLAPTNSFLPRPDFLASRNVYLPAAGIATLVAGALLWVAARRELKTRETSSVPAGSDAELIPRLAVAAVFAVLFCYWAFSSYSWAQCFAKPEGVWARSAKVAPDHSVVRLNLACAMLGRLSGQPSGLDDLAKAERELRAALAAEDSPTMRYHSGRHKAQRQGLAARLLAFMYYERKDYPQAELFFRRSWEQLPTQPTWVGWAACCRDGGLSAQLADVVSEGEKRWPDQWWPRALRGLQQAKTAGFTAQVCSDLQAAERAPNESVPELRWLQVRAIEALSSRESDPGRAKRLQERLRLLLQ